MVAKPPMPEAMMVAVRLRSAPVEGAHAAWAMA
jgi:hypothetical protein